MEEPQELPRSVTTPSGLFFHGAAPVSAATAVPENTESAAAPESETAEIDLSSEWEQDLSVDSVPAVQEPVAAVEEVSPTPVIASINSEPAQAEVEPAPVEVAEPVTPNLDESIEEVRFYLGQGMTDQADELLAKLEALSPGLPELAVLRLGVDSARQIGVTLPEPEIEAIPEAPAIEEAPAAAAAGRQPWPSERPVLQEMVSEIEASLGDGFVAETPAMEEAPVAYAEPVVESTASAQQFRAGTLDEFVSDLEASLGNDFPSAPAAVVPQAPARVAAVPVARAAAAATSSAAARSATGAAPALQIPQPVSAPQAVQPFAGVDLSDMFGELKSELEAGGTSADEDPETHYNLGVAFREMGLLDEAIGEFQKVCQATEHGHSFNQIMQTYTWLAQCFLDKGVPEAAVRWYEKALKIPSIDQETRTALHYELASSFENAGNRPAALSNFLEVYGSNIDYRDVGERIKALRT